MCIERNHPEVSVRRLYELLSRSNLYDTPKGESAENLRFMELFDNQSLETPSMDLGKCHFKQRQVLPIKVITECIVFMAPLPLIDTLKPYFGKRFRSSYEQYRDPRSVL